MAQDTTKVTIYRTLSSTFNPNIDTVIGVDTTIVAGSPNWSVATQNWTAGRWNIYPIAEDLAGNKNTLQPQDVLAGIITSSPMKVSDLENWSIGEMSSVLLGLTEE